MDSADNRTLVIVWDIACGTCGAKVDQPCTGTDGRPLPFGVGCLSRVGAVEPWTGRVVHGG